MDCPSCGAPTSVLETRRAAKSSAGAVRRRRACTACGGRFSTAERIERPALHVHKRNGRRQRFDRVKLRGALIRAGHKRDVADADIEKLVERIESEAANAGGEIESARVGELCLAGLAELDQGAWLQFLAVYDPERLSALPARHPGNSGIRSGPLGDPSEKTRNKRFSGPGSIRAEEDDARLPAENN